MTTTDPASAPAAPTPNPADPGKSPKPNDPEALARHAAELLEEKRKEREARLAAEARVQALETEKRQREEKALEDQNQWQTLAQKREQELAEANAKVAAAAQRELEGRKLNAFLKALGHALDGKFWGLVPIESIKASEHGEIDAASAQAVAEQFKQQYPETMPSPNGGRGTGLANDPPKGTPGKLSPEEYHRLPRAEQKKQYLNVAWTTGPKK